MQYISSRHHESQTALRDVDARPRKKSRTDFPTIDEFLAGYKHERASIFQFLSSLDDVAISPQQVAVSQNHNILTPELSASSVVTSCQRSCCANMCAPSDQHTKFNSPADAKEEQRRVKNREYQRRFRERRRLLQYKHISNHHTLF